jgi:uncharacterized membrane protein YfcA
MLPIDEALLLVALGIIIGVYSISIGAGGGFLVAPLLLLRHPDADPVVITTASLAVVVITSLASSAVVLRERRVDLPVAFVLAAISIPAGLLGALGTAALPREVFAVGFAILLVALALYLVRWPTAPPPPLGATGAPRHIEDRQGHSFDYRIPVRRSIAPNLGMAFLAALAGIGGGSIGVPIMTRIMRIPHAIAVPTIQVRSAMNAGAIVLFHLALGHAGDPMRDVIFLGIGVIIANPFGQRVRRSVGEGPLMHALALSLLLVAARTAFGAFQ